MHCVSVASTIATGATVAPRTPRSTQCFLGESRGRCALRGRRSPHFGSSHTVRQHTVQVRASTNDDKDKGENRAVLDAFFVGRALAEVVNEKLGTAVGELLSEVAKRDSERRREMRDFQEEVRKRARDQQQRAVSSTVESPSTASAPEESTKSEEPTTPKADASSKLEDSVGDLKSEVSQAKQELDDLKNSET
mmetsp:Transcript_177/g.454  ORF Transcript_177/g.454 Transcript_177/m.454 type:complete len:193 (-) Transcript_177:328-906(-)|eukprot:CAMPEP_0118933704 /NCGR_PEP_ID=MMETSP1169-20130426/12237_1 /TAXON_ID=36882 /ORGANISM="Pyramimonas obovata, Strain CCMP722" /LENGTH=192 /DNA_ID=CAMNT_0006876509 /DNA_START=48 /DNA_END=626 /DNA_ORIENTATION=-